MYLLFTDYYTVTGTTCTMTTEFVCNDGTTCLLVGNICDGTTSQCPNDEDELACGSGEIIEIYSNNSEIGC